MLTRAQRRTACALVIAVWIGEVFLGVAAYIPPAPISAEAPDDQFSAERARAILKDLVGDGIPHPIGSPQNAIVRERILRYFHKFGYDTDVQVAQVERRPKMPKIRNIIARRPGTDEHATVMLVAHYDSVVNGPGACDDGVAVAAILENARMMRQLPPSRNDILYLITDGEEIDLLGARAFVAENPLSADVKVVINLEARGTSGPSLMFQTSDDESWLIPLFARHATRPVTSSLFAEVYKALPNDTDFTIFKAHDMEGYNFAFVRDVRNYHTANDNYENADPRSLQHHGQNAWQTLRAVADFDLDQRSGGRLIYTDVLGRFVIWWPASINSILAGSILAGTIIAGAIARWRRLFPAVRWRIMVTVPLMLVVALLASLPCAWVAGFKVLRGQVSVNHGSLLVLLFWAVTLSMAIGSIPFTRLGRVDTWSAWLGAWCLWNGIGFICAWFVPGVSYLFILPGAVAMITGLIAALVPRTLALPALIIACCAGPITAGLWWLPMQVLLYDGVGFLLPPVYSICAGLLTITLVPMVLAMPDSAGNVGTAGMAV